MKSPTPRDAHSTHALPPFNSRDPLVLADPSPFWRRYRDADPVHRSSFERRGARRDALWLFRHRDVLDAFSSEHLGSDPTAGRKPRSQPKYPNGIRPLFEMLQNFMLVHEGAKHARLRAPVSRAFTPRVVERILPDLEEYTDRLLEAALASGRFDAAKDFAMPLSVRTMGALLGIPAADRREFSLEFYKLQGTFIPGATLEVLQRAARGTERLRAMFADLLKIRRAEPEGDLISGLAAIDESELSLDERTSTCILLLGAAHVTTVRTSTTGLLTLIRNPDQMERLRAGEVTISSVVEELLRFDAWIGVRYANSNTEIAGAEVRKGDVVALAVGSANRDPEVFGEPDMLDLGRNPKQHLSLGHGTHFCLGASLARAELQIAYAGLLRKAAHLRLGDEPLEWRDDGVGRGLIALPVQLEV